MFSRLTKWLSVGLAVLAVTAVMFAMHFRGALAVSADRQHRAEERASQLDVALKASEKARAAEHAQAEQFQAIAQQYEQDKKDAERSAKHLADDIASERIRLRAEWSCKADPVPAATAGTREPDAAADLRAEGASRLIGNADAADAEIRRLQEVLRAERQ